MSKFVDRSIEVAQTKTWRDYRIKKAEQIKSYGTLSNGPTYAYLESYKEKRENGE